MFGLRICKDCGRSFEPKHNRPLHCLDCHRAATLVNECDRCGRMFAVKLHEIDGEKFCGQCATKGPDPTPEEIAAKCAAIRAGWTQADMIGAMRGSRGEPGEL